MDVVYCSWICFPVNEMMYFLYLDSSNNIGMSCQKGGRHTQMPLLLQIFFYGIGPTSEGEKQSMPHNPRSTKTTHNEWRKQKRSKLNSNHISRFKCCRLHPSAVALFPYSGTCWGIKPTGMKTEWEYTLILFLHNCFNSFCSCHSK